MKDFALIIQVTMRAKGDDFRPKKTSVPTWNRANPALFYDRNANLSVQFQLTDQRVHILLVGRLDL